MPLDPPPTELELSDSCPLRVPADALTMDARHELGLYAQVSTDAPAGGAYSSAAAAAAAAEGAEGKRLVAVWLPVSSMRDFELADRSVHVRFESSHISSALAAAGLPESSECADGERGGGSAQLVAVLSPDEVAQPATELCARTPSAPYTRCTERALRHMTTLFPCHRRPTAARFTLRLCISLRQMSSLSSHRIVRLPGRKHA